MASKDALATAVESVFLSGVSINQSGEQLNMVDALEDVAAAIRSGCRHLGTEDAATPMGAIEALSVAVKEAGGDIRAGLEALAEAVGQLDRS
jgi:hypothetical protein